MTLPLILALPVQQDVQQHVHMIPQDHIVIMLRPLVQLDISLLPLSQHRPLPTLLVPVVLPDVAHAL